MAYNNPLWLELQFGIVMCMELSQMREEIFKRRPEFAEIIRQWGQETLLSYYTQKFDPLMSPSQAVCDAIQFETTKILGAKTGVAAAKTIAQQHWVNTADHHGLLHHPYFYTAALARSHVLVRADATATVTLPFGGVSLSNDSYPRGFSFHDIHGQLQRVFFKSLSDRRLPVYALKCMPKAVLEHEAARCATVSLSLQAHERLQHFFTLALLDQRIWECDTYSAQLTILNVLLWKELFGDSRGDFVYLQIDDVANRLLLEKHLKAETDVYRLLFVSNWRESFVALFSNVVGSHTANSGTHFFWYIDAQQKTRRRLIVEGDTLVTEEKDVVIALSPERIAEGLELRELMPSTALMLIIIHGVEKLACAGGPSQLMYLTLILTQWRALLERWGQSTQTPTSQIWCGDNALFKTKGALAPASSLASLFDLYLYAEDRSTFVDETLLTTTISASVDALIPLLYTMYTQEKVPKSFSPHITSLMIT